VRKRLMINHIGAAVDRAS